MPIKQTGAYRARPYAGEADLIKVSQMLSDADALLNLGLSRTPDELRLFFESPALDLARNSRIWHSRDNQVLGYALLEVPPDGESGENPVGSLRFRAHPVYAKHIDAQIMAWAMLKIHELAAAKGVPGQLRTNAGERDVERIAMLEQLGFAPLRVFRRLIRDHRLPIPDPQFPAGFTVRAAKPEQDAEAYTALFNESFHDHWDHHDLTIAQYRHDRGTTPHYDPRHDLIVLAPDGTFAAFCWSFRQNDTTALLHQIGTRKGYRRLGLGRAIMRTALQQLQADYFERVELFVDSQNVNQAMVLYESEGFALKYVMTTYAKPISHDLGKFMHGVE